MLLIFGLAAIYYENFQRLNVSKIHIFAKSNQKGKKGAKSVKSKVLQVRIFEAKCPFRKKNLKSTQKCKLFFLIQKKIKI